MGAMVACFVVYVIIICVIMLHVLFLLKEKLYTKLSKQDKESRLRQLAYFGFVFACLLSGSIVTGFQAPEGSIKSLYGIKLGSAIQEVDLKSLDGKIFDFDRYFEYRMNLNSNYPEARLFAYKESDRFIRKVELEILFSKNDEEGIAKFRAEMERKFTELYKKKSLLLGKDYYDGLNTLKVFESSGTYEYPEKYKFTIVAYTDAEHNSTEVFDTKAKARNENINNTYKC